MRSLNIGLPTGGGCPSLSRALCLASTFLVTVALLSLIATASAQSRGDLNDRYAKYKGAWFSIEYPRGWTVTPLAWSKTSEMGSDSARFTSRSGDAEFYVFSPQWNGDPKEVAQDPAREVLVSHHLESASRSKLSSGGYVYNPVANWYTVRAKDHSYLRSWVDVEDKGLNVRHVFGIKYRSPQTYQKYRVQYAHFCQSLKQFSD